MSRPTEIRNGVDIGRFRPAPGRRARTEGCVFDDPSRAAAMGHAGRAVAEQRFSLPAMVAGYQGLYDSLLAERV